MLTPQLILHLADELVVDLFAGGGGASTGIEQAIGRHVDIAINHADDAVALHAMNHPQTTHYVSDVFEVDPRDVTQGRAVGLLWASPDCKHFSKAKGSKPVSKKIRSLAWVQQATKAMQAIHGGFTPNDSTRVGVQLEPDVRAKPPSAAPQE